MLSVQDSIESLTYALLNTKRPMVLVSGEPGTGKTHLITKALEKAGVGNRHYTTYAPMRRKSIDGWKRFEGWLKAQKKQVVIIESIDLMPKENQAIFQLYLDRFKKRAEKSSINLSFIFTSTTNIKELRDNRDFLISPLYEQITDWVIHLSPLRNRPDFDTLVKDVWNEEAEWPSDVKLLDWLHYHKPELKGNFRDIIRLRERWKLYAYVQKMSQGEAFEKIKITYRDIGFGAPIAATKGAFSYRIEDENKLEELVKRFKRHIIQEAVDLYGKQKVVALKLDIVEKTVSRILSGKE